MIKLAFYDPSGNVEMTQTHAHRLQSLAGKRIGLLSNDQWQAYRTLPLIKAMLEEDFPDCDVLPLNTFQQGVSAIASEETLRRLKDSGVDAVVIGNAA
jgi:Asp/Glu/hydantoin racemase